MLLTGPAIRKAIADGLITVSPYDPNRINPNSLNLAMDKHIVLYEKMVPTHRWHEEMERYRVHRVQEDIDYRRTASEAPPSHWVPPALFGPIVVPAYHKLHESRPIPEPLDMAIEEKTVAYEILPEGFVLYPGLMYLATTVERTASPKHAPKIDGRSSIGRLNLRIHATAGFGDTGFNGHWTLEMSVDYPLRIYANVEVCQIAFSEVVGETVDYCSKYQGQVLPTASQLWKELQNRG